MHIEPAFFSAERPFLISGPCVAESMDLCLEVAESMKEACGKRGIPYIFKASFDKANRTSLNGNRGLGLEKGLEILERVKNTVGVPVLTDVHESWQLPYLEKVVDVIQIPAFLCRQTDLLVEAGKTKCYLNIKKGQFLSPEDMVYVVEKTGRKDKSCWLTERGTTFGYRDLVVDFRGIYKMKQWGPVVFDATHSVQSPGAKNGQSGGERGMAVVLAKAAAALGVQGFFMETHPFPDRALSDAANTLPLSGMPDVLDMILEVYSISKIPSF
ncbi:MAG: 3-deoxy-8-phosphooctulonate synthase [Bacteroidetes bacterium]|nr:3-deoxy-8-phosphooctulonate synthase [Bacteroidota bacterium]